MYALIEWERLSRWARGNSITSMKRKKMHVGVTTSIIIPPTTLFVGLQGCRFIDGSLIISQPITYSGLHHGTQKTFVLSCCVQCTHFPYFRAVCILIVKSCANNLSWRSEATRFDCFQEEYFTRKKLLVLNRKSPTTPPIEKYIYYTG